MKYSIDRIEGTIAVLENIEDKNIIEIELINLPKGIKEGSIIELINNKFEIKNNEEEERRKRIQEKLNRLQQN